MERSFEKCPRRRFSRDNGGLWGFKSRGRNDAPRALRTPPAAGVYPAVAQRSTLHVVLNGGESLGRFSLESCEPGGARDEIGEKDVGQDVVGIFGRRIDA